MISDLSGAVSSQSDTGSGLCLTFEEFQRAFLLELNSDRFAESPNSRPGAKQSATAKEFRRTGAICRFDEDFLRSIYQLVAEHSRLLDERRRISDIRQESVPSLVRLRNAMKTVVSVKKQLAEVEKNIQGLADPEVWRQVKAVLAGLESEIRTKQDSHTSRLHPLDRDPPAIKVKWEPVLKGHNYSLASLKKKAPDQWLYQVLNDTLESRLVGLRISKMTRYRIMSAVLKPFGLNVQAMTFKLYFESKKKTALPVKKS
jgi:hypothetical protein